MVKCAVCHQDNPPDRRRCAHCGTPLSPAGGGPLMAAGRLQITIPDGDHAQLMIAAPGAKGGHTLGRSDNHSDFMPDIDLAPFRAHEKGVSRRHAALIYQGNHVYILDLRSSNGTYLNETPLSAETPHPLFQGDVLRLGKLRLSVTQPAH